MLDERKLVSSFKNLKQDISYLQKEILKLKEILNSPKKKTPKLTLWFTGLPCSGKTTIAKKLKTILLNQGYEVVHLDGDDVRQGLNQDLKFSKKDRNENLRRIAHVAKLFNEKGNLVIASFVSPTNEFRKMIKKIIKNMKLIYVKCSVEACEKRDIKGMYKKARKGIIKQFTGISAPFEEPPSPDLIINTETESIEESTQNLTNFLSKYL